MISRPDSDSEPGDAPRPVAVSVSSILRRIKGGLNRLGSIRIQGEIHSIKPYPSGHVYLDLKDETDDALLHCVIWRRNAYALSRLPEQGEAVILTGALDVFEGRGQLQFNVTAVEAVGDGALFARFEALKKKLLAEGLFDPSIKKSLPAYPRAVGVVTSTETAALQDVMKTRAVLAPWVPFVVYHAAVQGEAAEGELLAALTKVKEENRVDVLLLVRGGGSLADLWSFNSEAIARLLRTMPMPVVTGVGHETDFTIADMAGDVRAPTPTGACSLVLRGWSEAPQRLQTLEGRLMTLTTSALRMHRLRLTHGARLSMAMKANLMRLRSALPRPESLRRDYETYLDILTERLDRNAMTLESRGRLVHQAAESKLALAQASLARVRPKTDRLAGNLDRLGESLTQRFEASLERRAARLEKLAASLNALDVSRTLARGFSLAVNEEGKLVRRAEDLRQGESLRLHFARGTARTRVEEAFPQSEK